MTTFTFNQFAVHHLPPRRAEVLARAALGYTAKEAAREMGTSAAYVEQELKLLMQKLQAKNRTHLVTQAWASGVIQKLVIACVMACASVVTAGTDDLARPKSSSRRFRDEISLEVAA